MRKILLAILLLALGAFGHFHPDLAPHINLLQAASATEPAQASVIKRPPNARAELADRWIDSRGYFVFPPGDGFAEPPRDETLAVGTTIDRYGQPGGRFLAPSGTSYEARALPYDRAKMDYYRYEVIKALTVKAGTAVPWFDQAGGGIQYKTDKTVQQLIDEGYLREIRE